MIKIVFIAIVGRTGELNRAGRVLVAPKGAVPHSDYPLPVFLGETQVGTVDQVAVCDRRVIVFGHLDPELVDEERVRRLSAGFDSFSPRMRVGRSGVRVEDRVERITNWKITALEIRDAYDGDELNMPPAQVEIMNVKEENDGSYRTSLLGL